MLGCGEYDVFLMERGGSRMVKQLKFTSLEWNRAVDDVSAANVILAGIQGKQGTFCCDDANLIVPWKHEIGIYRNEARVWAGPVINTAATKTGFSVNCRDLMVWMKHRRLRNNHNFVQVDLSSVFNAYARDALLPDNSMGIVIVATPCGVKGDRRVLAQQYKMAWPELDELARTGVDWTVVDRQVIVGNFELQLDPVGTFTDGSFVEFDEFDVKGDNLVTDAFTVGDGVGEAGASIVAGYSGGDRATYGVHEQVYQESSIRDVPSARRNAKSRFDLNKEPAKLFTGGTLSQEAEVEVSELIAGRAVKLLISDNICNTIFGIHRLSGVQGSMGPDHDRISIKVQPIGTTGIIEAA